MKQTGYRIPSSSILREEGDAMRTPDEVVAAVRLKELGWGTRRIAEELGMSRNTVREAIRRGGWKPYGNLGRPHVLDQHEKWLREAFKRHGGNAEVLRQELERECGQKVSLRTVERAVKPWRAELEAAARATVRFETAPGRQMQMDFGTRRVEIGGQVIQVHLFVATLGYSRRPFVAAFTHERQAAWFEGIERAFAHFGGVPREVLLDNAPPLVTSHNPETREVVFNDRFMAFAKHWGFTPRACQPFRPRTKGKDESGVGYVKRNALAGRCFESWAAFESHLEWWMREVADVRVHGTTGERPIDRFERDEAQALAALDGRPPFEQTRRLSRRVNSEACVEVDTNAYSVPWRHIGAVVSVEVTGATVRVVHNGDELARHGEVRAGARRRVIDPTHLEGVVAERRPLPEASPPTDPLIRPLAEYEALTGGTWS